MSSSPRLSGEGGAGGSITRKLQATENAKQALELEVQEGKRKLKEQGGQQERIIQKQKHDLRQLGLDVLSKDKDIARLQEEVERLRTHSTPVDTHVSTPDDVDKRKLRDEVALLRKQVFAKDKIILTLEAKVQALEEQEQKLRSYYDKKIENDTERMQKLYNKAAEFQRELKTAQQLRVTQPNGNKEAVGPQIDVAVAVHLATLLAHHEAELRKATETVSVLETARALLSEDQTRQYARIKELELSESKARQQASDLQVKLTVSEEEARLLKQSFVKPATVKFNLPAEEQPSGRVRRGSIPSARMTEALTENNDTNTMLEAETPAAEGVSEQQSSDEKRKLRRKTKVSTKEISDYLEKQRTPIDATVDSGT